MAQDEHDLPSPEAEYEPIQQPAMPHRRRWRVVFAMVFGCLLLAGIYGWMTREQIANRLISSELRKLNLPAQYEIESIGPEAQVLRNVVIGDPKRPDLTIARVDANLIAGRVTLVGPRLYGSYRNGKLSFGSLDSVIFKKGTQPFRLPKLDLTIVDGRGLLESDFGPVGFKAEGKGPLRDGFSGIVAAVAPHLEMSGCKAQKASFFAKVTVAREKPHIAGPVRLGSLACPAQHLHLASAVVRLDATMRQALDGGEGRLQLATGAWTMGKNRIASAEGTSHFTYRNQAFTARYRLTGKSVATPQLAADTLGIDGVLRTDNGFARLEVDGDGKGAGFRLSRAMSKTLANAAKASQGTLAAPVVTRLRTALLREGRGSRLSANFILRRTGDSISMVVPQAVLRGGSGQALLSFSRLQVSDTDKSFPRLAGNFATGGKGLPRIVGRLQGKSDGGLTVQIHMPEYRAGPSRLALPKLTLVRSGGGTLDISGEARVSGVLPGGHAEGLVLPLEGKWSAQGGLALWRKCVDVRFDKLVLANLEIDRHKVPFCPAKGRAILRFGHGPTRIAAGVPALELSGKLGETPVRIASGPIGFAYPDKLAAHSLEVTLGPEGQASRFHIADLDMTAGKEVAGTFAGADVKLNAVPLDMSDMAGNWRFADGQLTLTDGSLKLSDRQRDARFQPLVAHNATLRLADNMITAEAKLREPGSDREIVRTEIRHDLGSGRGSVDLFFDGVRFDKTLQPDTLSNLALGIIANAKGTVRGRGRIDWTEKGVTSHGSFSTKSLDFAAAFGPVKGLSGTVVFTDLLNLVTAPNQRLHIASINPGIEVDDGVLSFELKPGKVLTINGAYWPFLGGELNLLPTQMTIGGPANYHYTLTIKGLDAAQLIQKMDLANISATGTFDGVLPLVFDQNGGHIVKGSLVSRPPGGNLSYVGKLTYENLSTIANYAFASLKSLDYRVMRVDMNGSLSGEIVTRVSFDGIRQGKLAKRNFLTRQIAKLPIHFNVNIKAPFFQLVTSMRSLYDPSYVRDPRSLGLIDAHGHPIPRKPASSAPSGAPSGSIQPPASEDVQ